MGSPLLDWTSGSRPDAHLECEDNVANYSIFSGVLTPAEPGRNGGRAIFEKIVQKLSRTTMWPNAANLLKRMAPQAGFEPATLRLTAKHANSSASLEPET